jgi:hypothetical protein
VTNRSDGLTVIVNEPARGVVAKIREWLGRYGFAECAGVACALAGSFLVRRLTGNALAAAYGGALGETIGYAGVIVAREFRDEARAARADGKSSLTRSARDVAVDLLAEFGPSGILDTLVVRPMSMGVGVFLFGATRGLIAGKLAADVVFYIPVIFMYEYRKRVRKGQGRRE